MKCPNIFLFDRKQNIEFDISNKMLDNSTDTIRQLMQDDMRIQKIVLHYYL